MCCCGKPTTNGTPGVYSWDGKNFSTRAAQPPTLALDDILAWDGPGRCGGIDSHSHHFCLVRARHGRVCLLVRHGGGDERIELSGWPLESFMNVPEPSQYWMMHAVYYAQHSARRAGEDTQAQYWRRAAVDRRIKVRKVRGQNLARVTVDPPK